MTETPNEGTVPSSEPGEDYAGDTAEEVVGPDDTAEPKAPPEPDLPDPGQEE